MLDNEFYRGGEEWTQSSDLKATLEPAFRKLEAEKPRETPKKVRKKAFKSGFAGILTVTVLSTALMAPKPAETVSGAYYCGICGAPDCPYWVSSEKFGQGDAEGLTLMMPPKYNESDPAWLIKLPDEQPDLWGNYSWLSPVLDFGRRMRIQLDFSALCQPGFAPYDSCNIVNMVNTKTWYGSYMQYDQMREFQKDQPAAVTFQIYEGMIDDSLLYGNDIYLQLLYSPGKEPPPEGFGMEWNPGPCLTVPAGNSEGEWSHIYYRIYAGSMPDRRVRQFLGAIKAYYPETGERLDLGYTMVLQENETVGLKSGVSYAPEGYSQGWLPDEGEGKYFAYGGQSCEVDIGQNDEKNNANIRIASNSWLDIADYISKLSSNAGQAGHRMHLFCRQLEDLSYRKIIYRAFLVEIKDDSDAAFCCMLILIPLQEPQIEISFEAYISGRQMQQSLDQIQSANDFSRVFSEIDWHPVLDSISLR